jgi:hypothetical protein
MSNPEIGSVEFERNLSKPDPEIDKKIPKPTLPEREHYSDITEEHQPADRATESLPDIEREQQPVVSHQDRRHK